jgi:hypothetical protein
MEPVKLDCYEIGVRVPVLATNFMLLYDNQTSSVVYLAS